ncbi:MAG: hypothetical protein M1829_001464 [Trizodia sp. TS-e1964]|nr:MAG: hypothetical protein M1829_001464 [Trizodia sp. TS-e1964]
MTLNQLSSPANQQLIQQRTAAVVAYARDTDNRATDRFAFSWQYYNLARRLEITGNSFLKFYRDGVPGATGQEQLVIEKSKEWLAGFVTAQQEDAETLAGWVREICSQNPDIEGCKEALPML